MKTNKKQNILEKNINIINKLFLFSLFFLNISCKNEQYDWSAATNFPYFHPANGLITFLKDGKMVGNLSTGAGISGNWSSISVIQKTVPTGIIPDSLEVEWTDNIENCEYKGAAKLPLETIEKLFEQGYTRDINIGMAPGGNVCVWVQEIEILRFKVKQVGKLKTDAEKQNIINGLPDNSELKTYLINNPINYKNWEKPDPSYELDFGFCNEANSSYEVFGTFISKEGIKNDFNDYYLDYCGWNKPCNKEVDYQGKSYRQYGENYNKYKHQLPVYLELTWRLKNLNYTTEIILPKDFPKRFAKSFINPKTGKKCNFHRIVFGLEKDNEHCIIWLDGPDKQEKIMRFKGKKSIVDSVGLKSGGYATEITYY